MLAIKESFYRFISPSEDSEIRKVNESIKNIIPVIWLLGKTGAGKSTFIKTVTGDDGVLVGNGYSPCTQNSSEFLFPVDKPIVNFIDTRGLAEASYDPSVDIDALSNQSNQIVLLMRMDEQCQGEVLSNLRKIQKASKGKSLSSNLLVIYSHASSVSSEERSKIADSFDEQISKHWRGDYKCEIVDFHTGVGVDSLKQSLADLMPLVMGAMALSSDIKYFAYSRLKQDILWYSLSSGAADAIPVAGAFTVPVIQGKMLYDIASKIGVEWNKREFIEFSSALGSSIAAQFGLSFVARQATKLIPVYGQTAGIALSASIGFGSTYALGVAGCYYMQCKKNGEVIDNEALRTMFQDALVSNKSSK
ncbi:GTPase [Vibrio splendidus]|nr:GTPase [Vibrio splendidus]MCC4880464.1 GTP-binding DUF697 domain-containing protein [Vibrio splendidus]